MNLEQFIQSLEVKKLHEVKSGNSIDFSFEEPHYLLETSGSQFKKKIIHSLSSIKASCENFNTQFAVGPQDRWGLCLSQKHVAGFSVIARGFFAELEEPVSFVPSYEGLKKALKKENFSLLSLVPTQLYDLVQNQIQAPSFLRAVFLGGASLDYGLYKEAQKLHWNVIPCYGSTETFAQMSYSLDGKVYQPYPGWSIDRSREGELLLQGPSLFSYKYLDGELIKRKSTFFATGDRVVEEKGTYAGTGDLQNAKFFRLEGKMGSLVKIKGSYFDFELFKKDFFVFCREHELDARRYIPVLGQSLRDGALLFLLCDHFCEEELELIYKSFSELQGAYFFEDLGRLRGEISKPKRGLIEDALGVTLLSV